MEEEGVFSAFCVANTEADPRSSLICGEFRAKIPRHWTRKGVTGKRPLTIQYVPTCRKFRAVRKEFLRREGGFESDFCYREEKEGEEGQFLVGRVRNSFFHRRMNAPVGGGGAVPPREGKRGHRE